MKEDILIRIRLLGKDSRNLEIAVIIGLDDKLNSKFYIGCESQTKGLLHKMIIDMISRELDNLFKTSYE